MKQQENSQGVRASRAGIEKLEEKRNEKDWTYDLLAKKAGVSVDTVKRLKSGESVRKDSIRRIVKALELQPQNIVAPDEWEAPVKKPKQQQTPAISSAIDWRKICRTMLEKHKRLTTNETISADDMRFDLDEIYVPLKLEERRQRDQCSGDANPIQDFRLCQSTEYKGEQQFEYSAFLEKILRQGEGKTKEKKSH